MELQPVSELTGRRLAEQARPGPRPAERTAAELAAALTLTAVRLAQVRMRTCSAPACNRPAQTCDFDHVIPHDQGRPDLQLQPAPHCRL